jgi:hypothetical protein
VKVVGTPQFEPYVMPKEDFYKNFQLSDQTSNLHSCADVSIGRMISAIKKIITN